VTHDGWRTGLALAAGITAPPTVAAALVPLRATIDNANVALVLAAVVVAVATTGSRPAVVAAAASAAGWFDFFHTRPYESFTVNDERDIVTALVLLTVGVVVGELAIRSRRHRAAATTSSGDIALIHAVAERVAAGEPSELVAAEVADELVRLLELRDCRFEPGLGWLEGQTVAQLERNGDVVHGGVRWRVESLGLPSRGVGLEVQGGGQTYGRYLLLPTAGVAVSFERRIVAVALADQVGAGFAAHSRAAAT
jgi:K+-sensing histidine kinase KdpD